MIRNGAHIYYKFQVLFKHSNMSTAILKVGLTSLKLDV